jgi:hypothetical protein
LYKKHLNGDYVNGLLILMTLFVFLLISSSCIYMPIPAIGLSSQKGVVNKGLIKSLKQGETTREDLLLLAGEPDARYEKDRYFIYEWEALEAFVAIPGGGDAVPIKHYFCVEFDEKNRIKKLEHIKSSLFKSADTAQDEMYKWVHGSGQ